MIIYKKILCFFILNVSLILGTNAQNNDGKVRIIMIGAHPDDCDVQGGGTAILYAKMGYAVKFVSVTNGDAGHQTMKGEALAKRRYAEAQEAAGDRELRRPSGSGAGGAQEAATRGGTS